MDNILHFDTDYPSVFLINGSFSERADIRNKENEVLYITVLPLRAVLQPYTVKLIGGKALCNQDLCYIYKLEEHHYYIKLLERYNYVYTPKKQQDLPAGNAIIKLFRNIKEKHLPEARALMTDSLSSSIDNLSLSGFFDDFIDIIENKGYVGAPDYGYFMINKNNKGVLFIFEVKGGLIDNIYEMPAIQ